MQNIHTSTPLLHSLVSPIHSFILLYFSLMHGTGNNEHTPVNIIKIILSTRYRAPYIRLITKILINNIILTAHQDTTGTIITTRNYKKKKYQLQYMQKLSKYSRLQISHVVTQCVLSLSFILSLPVINMLAMSSSGSLYFLTT